MPVVQRHNATKQATTEVEVTFTFANPGMESIEAYRNALAALQPAVESELADASAIVPPAAQSAFHASVINAISLHQDGMNGNIVYYTNVLDTGTGELEALVAANDAFLEANRLWSQEILPQLEALVAEAGS